MVNIRRLFAASSAAVLLAAGAGIVKGFNPQPDPPGVWGMIGVTPSDTMRLNVVNMQFSGAPPDPCAVQFRFLNAQGQILKQEIVTVKPTQAASFDITGVEAGGGFRTELHPVLLLSTSNGVGCSAVGSVEVFNSASGETSVFAHPIFIPPPSAQITGRQ